MNVEKGSTVILYTESDYMIENAIVPNIAGLTREQAKTALKTVGLNLSSEGSAVDQADAVASTDQNFVPNTEAPVGSAVSVTFITKNVGSQ